MGTRKGLGKPRKSLYGGNANTLKTSEFSRLERLLAISVNLLLRRPPPLPPPPLFLGCFFPSLCLPLRSNNFSQTLLIVPILECRAIWPSLHSSLFSRFWPKIPIKNFQKLLKSTKEQKICSIQNSASAFLPGLIHTPRPFSLIF